MQVGFCLNLTVCSINCVPLGVYINVYARALSPNEYELRTWIKVCMYWEHFAFIWAWNSLQNDQIMQYSTGHLLRLRLQKFKFLLYIYRFIHAMNFMVTLRLDFFQAIFQMQPKWLVLHILFADSISFFSLT